jgi:hypothetical protein
VLNNRVKTLLSKSHFHLNISLDSLQKETYESIRVNAKFERVMENLRWFREYAREKGTFFGISVCMMRQNWQEAPDFIRFCNELDCPVYFHSVFYPLPSAIRALPKKELSDIGAYLQGFSFPEETPVQQKNSLHYRNFVQQILFWAASAPETEPSRSAGSADQLYELLAEHLQNAEPNGRPVAERLAHIRRKLDELKALLADRPEWSERFASMPLGEKSAMDRALSAVEQLSAAELLDLLADVPLTDKK